MTMEKAIEILNEHRWRGKGDWRVYIPDDNKYARASSVADKIAPILHEEGAETIIAIASWLDLCEACRPFAAVYNHKTKSINYGDVHAIPFECWRRLAALVEGE